MNENDSGIQIDIMARVDGISCMAGGHFHADADGDHVMRLADAIGRVMDHVESFAQANTYAVESYAITRGAKAMSVIGEMGGKDGERWKHELATIMGMVLRNLYVSLNANSTKVRDVTMNRVVTDVWNAANLVGRNVSLEKFRNESNVDEDAAKGKA